MMTDTNLKSIEACKTKLDQLMKFMDINVSAAVMIKCGFWKVIE